MNAVAVATVMPAKRETREDAGDEKSWQRLPNQKDHRCEYGNAERREQHRAPAVPVGHVAGEHETHHDSAGVDGVDDRDRERRKMVAVRIKTVKGARGGRERRQCQERKGYSPET